MKPERSTDRQDPVLVLDGLTKEYGGVIAVSGVTLSVSEGERIGILGPNGAGKTTLFKMVSGALPPTRGTVTLRGQDVTRRSMHKRARLGLGQTYQITNLFTGLRVKDNILVAARAAGGGAQGRFDRVVSQFNLGPVLEQRVGELAYGQQRRLEMALALAGGASVLLLDEPAAGLGPADREEMHATITGLSRELTVLLIEHDVDLTLGVSDRVVCLHQGCLVADERSDCIADNPKVQEIYLGVGGEA